MTEQYRERIPAADLVDLTLDDGWVVRRRLERPEGATGGHFSHGYIVERGTQRGFLKALDFGDAFKNDDPAAVLEKLTRAFNFEKELLYECKRENLRRIVTPLADGVVRVPGSPYPIQYIIFDLADRDVRRQTLTAKAIDFAWALETLHQVAVGLRQLHSIQVAHQDVKPSNILLFGPNDTKVGDLGSASRQGKESPRDQLEIAGDMSYAPIELLYGHLGTDWAYRRKATDLYQLGNLCYFLIHGVSLTSMLLRRMHDAHRPARWEGTYRDVLAYVSHAHSECLREFSNSVPQDIRNELVQLVTGLTNPDPRRRGHRKTLARGHNPLDLERVVSNLNRLAVRVRLRLKGHEF